MRTLRFKVAEDAQAATALVASAVAGGGVVLLPTETFYGLGADPQSRGGVEKVYRMKGRPAGMPLSVLCADWGQVEHLVEVPVRYRARLSRAWPGPLTVVLAARIGLAAAPGGTVAVRIPGHELLRTLLGRVGPLTGTSANRHGEAPATKAAEILTKLDELPDLVLDGGPAAAAAASTLVDLSGLEPRLLREGRMPWL